MNSAPVSVTVDLTKHLAGRRHFSIHRPGCAPMSPAELARQIKPCRVIIDGQEIEPAPEPFVSPPLFVPLKRAFFEAFERGEKREEFRIYGPRWNEITCAIGRPVVLSLGYGKARRLRGRVVSFKRDRHPILIPGWLECYGQKPGAEVAACIGIQIDR